MKLRRFILTALLFCLTLTLVACGENETSVPTSADASGGTDTSQGSDGTDDTDSPAETNNPFTEADPWDADKAIPSAVLATVKTPGEVLFSGLEWTGKPNSKDANGKTVNQSAIVSIGELPAHSSTTVVYKTLWEAYQGARNFDPSESSYYRLISGAGNPWMLAVYKNESDARKAGVLDEFYKPTYSMENAPQYQGKNKVSNYRSAYYGGFKEVTLPASWQTQGFDFPIYTNYEYPWNNDAYGNGAYTVPVAPSKTNPVGFYRTTVDVDSEWLASGRRVILSFGGVESAYYLYVNGYEVGYSEDSFDTSEFDITPYLNKNGQKNLIAVRVYRWCDGSYFENQDFLRLAGIFRDVALYSVPGVSIADYTVVTDLDKNYVNANLSLSLKINNATTSDYEDGFFSADVRLIDKNGNSIFADAPLHGTVPALASGKDSTVKINRTVTAPHLWSDEDPYLYTLIISLYDKNGVYYGSIAQQLGFREITFTPTRSAGAANNKYSQILLNGQPLVFRGVNRHDNDPATGRYISRELCETDVKIMKNLNINAVRTSHYPNDRYFYDMCDKYGILVLAECNIETHYGVSTDDTARYFTALVKDRVNTFTEYAKNRTSIVMWSIGNETSAGTAVYTNVISELKKKDPTRPVHFESLGSGSGVDVASAMYSSVYDVKGRGEAANRMPFVICEYAHAMGNSVGNLYEYWQVIRSYDNLLGGFIWDFVDQSIWTPLPASAALDYYNTKMFLGYGGSWGDSPNQGNFLQNGIISSDRTLQPECAEVKYVYQPLWFSADILTDSAKTVNVYNETNFTDLSAYTYRYELLANGQVVDSGTFSLSGAPKATVSTEIPYRLPADRTDREFLLTLTACYSEDTLFAKAGDVIASGQFPVYVEVEQEKADLSQMQGLTVKEEGDTVTVTGASFVLVFNKASGNITSYTYNGETVLTSGPVPSFDRAHLDNDKSSLGWDNVKASGMTGFSAQTSADGKSVTLTGTLKLSAGGCSISVSYTVFGGGEITVSWKLNPAETTGEMRKFGAVLTLPGDYENISFYGNGPEDTYNDRLRGSHAGIYHTTVTDSFFPYPYPQDTGNKTGIRWFGLTSDQKNTGLLLVAEGQMEASALHYTAAQLQSARYPYSLKNGTANTYLSADFGSRGTGGASCGPDTLSQYRLLNDGRDYSYSYTIVPYNKADADVNALARLWRDAPSFTAADIDRMKAESVDNRIAALLSDASPVKDVRKAYDALTDAQKALIKNLSLLISVEEGKKVVTEIQDLSPNGNVGTPVKGTLIVTDPTSPTGYAVAGGFTSSDKGGKINSALSGTANFTMGALVRLDDLDSNNVILAKGDQQVAIKTNGSGQLEFFIYQNGAWNAAVITDSAAAGVRVGQWMYIVGTREGNTLKFYVNGKLAATKAVSGAVGTSGAVFGVGADPASARYLRGSVAMAHVLPYALTAREVTETYNAIMNGSDLPIAPEKAVVWFDSSRFEYR